MKKFGFVLVFTLTFFLPAGWARPIEFTEAVHGYETGVQGLIAAETNPPIKDYLSARLGEVRALDKLEPGNPQLPAALTLLVQQRLALNPDREIRQSDPARAEATLYRDNLAKYLGQEYIELIKLQADLLDRKYFKTETSQNANFIEGVVNGYWGLTRADQGDPKTILRDSPTLGIHPWEAIFRFEPTLVMRSGPQAAIIGTAGLSYSYFPEIDRSDIANIRFKENFASKWVKKFGPRVGMGAARLDSKTRFVAGAGIQINAIGIWYLYEPKHHSSMIGFGLADLSKLKKALGFFY